MKDFLIGTDQRLLLGYCADSILNRSNKNTEIEGWFENNQLDVLFYDLLLFIMDNSLSFRDGTPMSDIQGFLEEDLGMYQISLTREQVVRLCDYMVKDILQNDGRIKRYRLFDTTQQKWVEKPVRLIEDSVVKDTLLYRLTEQGYDFLLRTREIDNEYSGWVSLLIMQQKLQHGNFKDSRDQCRQCLTILRREEAQFDSFTARVRQDIHSIGNEDYSCMITTYYENLQEEKKLTEEIIRIVKRYHDELTQRSDHAMRADQTIEENLRYLKDMADMLGEISGEESELLSRRYSVRDLYSEMLDASLAIEHLNRYDFYEHVIHPFVKINGTPQAEDYRSLVRPLFEPDNEKVFDLHILYEEEPEYTVEDTSEAVLTQEEEDDQEERERIQSYNDRYVVILDHLLEFCTLHPEGFSVRSFITWFEESLGEYYPYDPGDKSFYLLYLTMYAEGHIVLKEGMETDEVVTSEFDLQHTLQTIAQTHPDYYGIESLDVSGKEGADSYDIYDDAHQNIIGRIGMNTILIQPVFRRNEHE